MSENDLVKVQKCQTMDQKFVIMPENRPRKLKMSEKRSKKCKNDRRFLKIKMTF